MSRIHEHVWNPGENGTESPISRQSHNISEKRISLAGPGRRKSMKSPFYLYAVVAAFLISADSAAATTIHVPADYPTIQEGIDASVDGDTVLIAEGTYYENGVDFLGKAILVTGADPEDSLVVLNTVVDGDATDSVIYFHSHEDSTSILRGLTIRNGWSADFGGGVYCIHSSPAIRNCCIRGNTALSKGGGVYTYDSALILEDCFIFLNSTLEDGGGYAFYTSDPKIRRCRIDVNTATDDAGGVFCSENSSPIFFDSSISRNSSEGDGGGVFCISSSPFFENCVITGNSRPKYGGGVFCKNSEPFFLDCLISVNDASEAGGGIYCNESTIRISGGSVAGNSGGGGGGIFLLSSTGSLNRTTLLKNKALRDNGGGGLLCYQSIPAIINCTVALNDAVASNGGGIFFHKCSPEISHCTITDNWAYNRGGGIYCFDSSPTILNCILWNDSPMEIDKIFYSYPAVTYSDVEGGWPGEGNIDADPHFSDPILYDYHLQSSSPCIDAGTDCEVTDDIDGDSRPQRAYFDMGADEGSYEGPVSAVSPDSFLIVSILGEAADDDTLTISSLGSEPLEFTVIPGDESWLSLYGDLEGILQHGESSNILLQFDVAALEGGIYTDTISIVCNDLWRPEKEIPIRLEIRSHETIRVPENCSTIQEAIDIACESATVIVADGTYTGNKNKNLDYYGKAITLTSENGADFCIIDCENNGRGAIFQSGETSDARLEGITIRNGNLSGGTGGGIYCLESCPTITNCTISGNTSYSSGGGVHCADSAPIISDCMITENTADRDKGGGIHCSHHALPIIMNCTISGNHSDWSGGGISFESCEPSIQNSLITDNTAQARGGGIYCIRSSPTITNCTISGNKVPSWMSDGHGGGICCWASSPNIRYCSITENKAYYNGGGIYCTLNSSPTITNCILWADSPQEIYVSSGSPLVTYSDIESGWPGEGNIDADPLFIEPGGNCFHLRLDSPCIDAGTDCGVYEDIDGHIRPQKAGFDMGSDEVLERGLVIGFVQD